MLLSSSSCGDQAQGCPPGTPRQLHSQDLCHLLFLSPFLDTPFHYPCTFLSLPQPSLNKIIPKCFLLIVPVLLHLHPNLVFRYYCLDHLGRTVLLTCFSRHCWTCKILLPKRSQILPQMPLHLSVKLGPP